VFNFILDAISNALGFSKVEARGTLVLILIMLTGIAFSKFYEQSLKNPASFHEDEIAALDEWVAEVNSSYSLKTPSKDSRNSKSLARQHTRATHKKLEKESVEIDLALPDLPADRPITVRNLNLATAAELQVVKGIGPVLSDRIVKFRDKLGGFSGNSQLAEVYGLPPETINEVLRNFAVQSPPKPIDFNVDSAKALARHPYINYDLAWVILNYRKQHGDISSFEDLEKIQALDEEMLEKLKPYLN